MGFCVHFFAFCSVFIIFLLYYNIFYIFIIIYIFIIMYIIYIFYIIIYYILWYIIYYIFKKNQPMFSVAFCDWKGFGRLFATFLPFAAVPKCRCGCSIKTWRPTRPGWETKVVTLSSAPSRPKMKVWYTRFVTQTKLWWQFLQGKGLFAAMQ